MPHSSAKGGCPFRDHRRVVEAISYRYIGRCPGVEIDESITAIQTKPHNLTSFAHVDGTRVTYPATDVFATAAGVTDAPGFRGVFH